jgi:hypothetical protein
MNLVFCNPSHLCPETAAQAGQLAPVQGPIAAQLEHHFFTVEVL